MRGLFGIGFESSVTEHSLDLYLDLTVRP
uniref:Uncharacterized protein n=1 Tax=Anguilla anguilla TaxID=7936 RepID=A0A0E9TM66_ANGAN